MKAIPFLIGITLAGITGCFEGSEGPAGKDGLDGDGARKIDSLIVPYADVFLFQAYHSTSLYPKYEFSGKAMARIDSINSRYAWDTLSLSGYPQAAMIFRTDYDPGFWDAYYFRDGKRKTSSTDSADWWVKVSYSDESEEYLYDSFEPTTPTTTHDPIFLIYHEKIGFDLTILPSTGRGYSKIYYWK